ncbi:MAG: class IV adenylate cyclase [Candidatus Bathyarchaeia archaeon]
MLLIELKARLNGLEGVRSNLLQSGAQCSGSFHQIDTCFRVPKGNLKIRETEGQASAAIIFYERPNIPHIKKSYVMLIQAQPGDIAKELLTKFLPTKVIVEKIREIYILKETNVHLDQVTRLGNFIGLEQPTPDEASEIEKSRSLLADLCMKLGVKEEDLEALSCADLLLAQARGCR